MGEESVSVHRTAVCLVGIDGPSFEALRYLITHLNELQQSLEFELVAPNMDDELVQLLSGSKRIVAGEAFDNLVLGFAERQDAYNAVWEDGYKMARAASCEYVIVSLARLSNNYYAWGVGRTSLLALGNWESSFAPPSLVEYALTLIMRLAASDAVPEVENAKHLATKGCLFDFNPNLTTVRLKVLSSIICSECGKAFVKADRQRLADDLRYLLGKTWLGKSDDPLAPAGICQKLGYDLFLTRGIQPSLVQTLKVKLQGDLVSEVLKLIAAVILAYVLFRLGFSAGDEN